MIFSRFAAALLITLALVASSLASPMRRLASPEHDPFYTPDDGWKDQEPGTILRTREIQPVEMGYLKLNVKGYQLLYRTNGVTKQIPSYTVTTVLVPEGYDHDKLVVGNVYEDSFSHKCAPSYTLRYGAPLFNDLEMSYQELFFTTLLNEGWVVTVPDHEGPQSAFTSGFLEGHAVLDAVRATLKFHKLNLASDAMVAGYGYSGGALATGWAASLQNVYAPELNVVGWSMGGTVANVREWLRYIDGTNGAGFVASALGGLVYSYPELGWVQDALTARGKEILRTVANRCLLGAQLSFPFQKILSNKTFANGDNFLSSSSNTSSVLNKLTLGHNAKYTPTAPVFMFHARGDEVMPYGEAETSAHYWCNNGARVHFQANKGLEMAHASTEYLNLPKVIFFLRDRFNHKKFMDTCKFEDVPDPWWDPKVLGTQFKDVLEQVLNLLGKRIGKDKQILRAQKIKHHKSHQS